MQIDDQRYRAEEKQRDQQHNSDQEEIKAVPGRIFSPGIDLNLRRQDHGFNRRLDLQFGERMI